jgi:hypothetical protein
MSSSIAQYIINIILRGYIEKSFEYTKNLFRTKVDSALKENDLPTQVRKVEMKSSAIVSEAEITKQTEIVNKVLAERQKKLDYEAQHLKDIKQVKDITRVNTYRTLATGETNEQARFREQIRKAREEQSIKELTENIKQNDFTNSR